MPRTPLEVQDSRKAIPLLEVALRRQVVYVEMGMSKTRQRLAALEQKYGCTLAAVDQTDVVVDPLDRVEWEGEAAMLQRLEMEKTLLATAHICA
jgi:hypothetical protein